MCNIAGYSGHRQAVPVLLEMLRRQAPYDGDMSTGVAVVHEGKLHFRKVVGDVDTLIRETDVLELPGTIGIAHSRPGGSIADGALHPFIPNSGKLALVTNGTAVSRYREDWDKSADFVDRQGCVFEHEWENPKGKSPKFSRNGHFLRPSEVRVHMIDCFLKQGMTPTQAMVRTDEGMYTDAVMVMLHADYPDSIFASRTSRPMNVILEGGEVYMATTRYGFPEELKNEPIMLPLGYGCVVSKDGIRVTQDRQEKEPVSDMTPFTYAEGYRRVEALLRSDEAPLYFDEVESAVGKMRDLWPGDHSVVQHARLVYDLLWQFDREGRLKREMRLQPQKEGSRHRWYFRLED